MNSPVYLLVAWWNSGVLYLLHVDLTEELKRYNIENEYRIEKQQIRHTIETIKMRYKISNNN